VLKHIAKDINDQCWTGIAALRESCFTYTTGCLIPRCQDHTRTLCHIMYSDFTHSYCICDIRDMRSLTLQTDSLPTVGTRILDLVVYRETLLCTVTVDTVGLEHICCCSESLIKRCAVQAHGHVNFTNIAI
jgi:hypothetical protein